MADFPKEIYTSLEGLENGSELIEKINGWKSGINNEARELRSQRNVALDYLGIDHSEGVNIESLSEKLTKTKEEKELLDREERDKRKREEESKMTEFELMEKRVKELAGSLELTQKQLQEKEMKVRLSERKNKIRASLSEKGVLPAYADDLTELINSRVIEKDGQVYFENSGTVLPINDGISKYLEGKDAFIGVKQAGGSGSSSGEPPKREETLAERRLRVEKSRNLY